MKEQISLFFKGFFIGIANIIPGVSGGTMAVSFGIYEKLITIASNIFHNFKQNLKFIIPILFGAVVAIFVLSGLISTCLDKYPVATPLFFVGLILGGFPLIYKKIGKKISKLSNMISFLFVIIALFIFSIVLKNNHEVSFISLEFMDYILLIIVGIIASITMIVPGISGSFVLMMLGYYQPILDTISSFLHFENFASNFLILFCFGIGILLGIVLISKFIRMCLEKYFEQTYSMIIAFVLSSIVMILYPLFQLETSLLEIIVGLFLFLIGGFISYHLEKQ